MPGGSWHHWLKSVPAPSKLPVITSSFREVEGRGVRSRWPAVLVQIVRAVYLYRWGAVLPLWRQGSVRLWRQGNGSGCQSRCSFSAVCFFLRIISPGLLCVFHLTCILCLPLGGWPAPPSRGHEPVSPSVHGLSLIPIIRSSQWKNRAQSWPTFPVCPQQAKPV